MGVESVRHPGDLGRHIMRDLGFGVGGTAEEMRGSGHVIPEMFVPGTEACGCRFWRPGLTSLPGTSPWGCSILACR